MSPLRRTKSADANAPVNRLRGDSCSQQRSKRLKNYQSERRAHEKTEQPFRFGCHSRSPLEGRRLEFRQSNTALCPALEKCIGSP